ncbi:MAG: hypothetical protein KZQ64_10205 [gamma proteobacterium symbiont of Bathyaustriella thionipta]|nr:hypothetical protein [gamma proteobacterium symbiont of Bathyaustriella thionipta]MCU7950651.1 hypothetical protein [gamma proteobacterium symbiont of Bathyaustriella thionipta]MCU7953743.1 hypothetical protein [gamma proteobacterium symbiont of Bathyaustriella thionipta]MCU7957142.1 hypothetical protein [gamma proteobacterium symbiont of Bathyaustriella thionipta]MCU7968439.1 hypothetical protein [gamma proteobacterium symbiont of Bathyaustriella thionipta]
MMFYFFALFLLLLSMASGVSLLLISFGLVIKGSSVPFWLIYIIGFLGCIGLMGKISTLETQRRIIQFASGFQILLGIIAAISIFLDKLIIVASSDVMILWVLFLLGITIGLWGLSRVSQMQNN